jgi:hypothetical protein
MPEVYTTTDAEERANLIEHTTAKLNNIRDLFEKENGVNFNPQVAEPTNSYNDPQKNAEVFPFEALIGTIKQDNKTFEIYIRLTPDGFLHNISAWDGGEQHSIKSTTEEFLQEVKSEEN